MKEQKIGRGFSPLFYLLLLSSALLYIWIFSNTPYGEDDWWWGIDKGMREFLTGGVNSRYVGNLLEVIVTRSEFLKTVLHGLIAAFIPFFIVVLVRSNTQPSLILNGKADRLPEAVLLLSNILFLTLPIDVWKDTYGWIAGFSNYGLAVFFLAAFQLLISRLFLHDAPDLSVAAGFGYFIFGICIQLVLENMTIYVFLVDFLLLIIMMIEKRSKAVRNLMLVMLAGNAIGLFIMFSSSIYQPLFHSGVVSGIRRLSFDPHDSLYSIFLLLNKRFIYFYPNRIFGNNWLMCSLISVLLFLLSGRGKRLIRFVVRIFAAFFFVYFVFTHFYGLLEDHIPRWNEMYTQWLNLLFFWGVFLSILILPWTGMKMRKILIFVWLSVLGILLPLVAVKLVESRYFLFSSLFLVEFGMFIFAEAYNDWESGQRVVEYIVLAVYLLVAIHRFSIYYEIGQGKQEQEALIRSAQNGEADRLYFEALPHSEYVVLNEPEDGTWAVATFREFFKIPDSVEFHNSLEGFSPEE